MATAIWWDGLAPGMAIAVRRVNNPGDVSVEPFGGFAEPGDDLGSEVRATQRYARGAFDFFDAEGKGWAVVTLDTNSLDFGLAPSGTVAGPVGEGDVERSAALQVLECAGIDWTRVTTADLQAIVAIATAAGAIPDDFEVI